MDPVSTYTLTSANDWPMFVFMMGGIGVVCALFLSIIGGLVGFMWWDLRKQITNITGNCNTKSSACQANVRAEFLQVWESIDQIAPRPQARGPITLNQPTE